MQATNNHKRIDNYSLFVSCNSKNEKSISTFREFWALLSQRLSDIYEKVGVTYLTMEDVKPNAFYKNEQAGIFVTFAKDNYSEDKLWEDVAQTLKTLGNDQNEVALIESLEFKLLVANHTELGAWLDASENGKFDDREYIDEAADPLQERPTRTGASLLT